MSSQSELGNHKSGSQHIHLGIQLVTIEKMSHFSLLKYYLVPFLMLTIDATAVSVPRP